jgi:hypothetical protein
LGPPEGSRAWFSRMLLGGLRRSEFAPGASPHAIDIRAVRD